MFAAMDGDCADTGRLAEDDEEDGVGILFVATATCLLGMVVGVAGFADGAIAFDAATDAVGFTGNPESAIKDKIWSTSSDLSCFFTEVILFPLFTGKVEAKSPKSPLLRLPTSARSSLGEFFTDINC